MSCFSSSYLCEIVAQCIARYDILRRRILNRTQKMRLENDDSLLLFHSCNCKKRMIVCRNNKHTNNNGIIRLTEKKVKTIQFKLIFSNNKYKVTKPKKNTISSNDKEFNNIKVFPVKLNTILITTNIIIKSFPKIVIDKIEITSKKNKKYKK